MTTVAEAEALIAAHMPSRPSESIDLADATGRVLAEPIAAERDQPPFDRVTMDGIAIASSAWSGGRRSFRIEAVLAAGAPGISCSGADSCIRIMTGAVRPAGTDAVVPIERVRIEGDTAVVDDSAFVEPGRFIHPQGSDRHQGDTVLEPGIVIGPAETAVLASAGRARIDVASVPRVAVVSTGDELVPVEATGIAPFQIRSSNDLAVASSLRRSGVAVTQRALLPDDPDAILTRVSELHEHNDILILSGGVSMGEFDFVPAVLDALGSELIFHRIAQKPGRPMWFGISGAGKPIFALPGNPVSTLLCMTRYVIPALRRSLGQQERAPEVARLAEDVIGPKDLTYFVPVVIEWSETGKAAAVPHPTNTSGDFATLAATDGFIELAAGDSKWPTKTAGRVYRW